MFMSTKDAPVKEEKESPKNAKKASKNAKKASKEEPVAEAKKAPKDAPPVQLGWNSHEAVVSCM